MNRTGNIAAHPSAITALISHLFLAILFFPCPSVPLFPVLWSLTSSRVVFLSLRGLVSFMEPQHVKDIPGNVERSPVCLSYKVYSVSSEHKQSGYFFLSQRTETKRWKAWKLGSYWAEHIKCSPLGVSFCKQSYYRKAVWMYHICTDLCICPFWLIDSTEMEGH